MTIIKTHGTTIFISYSRVSGCCTTLQTHNFFYSEERFMEYSMVNYEMKSQTTCTYLTNPAGVTLNVTSECPGLFAYAQISYVILTEEFGSLDPGISMVWGTNCTMSGCWMFAVTLRVSLYWPLEWIQELIMKKSYMFSIFIYKIKCLSHKSRLGTRQPDIFKIIFIISSPFLINVHLNIGVGFQYQRMQLNAIHFAWMNAVSNESERQAVPIDLIPAAFIM